jgi:hypothetical protein
VIRFPRAFAVTVLCATVLLAACPGDGPPGDDTSSPSTSATDGSPGPAGALEASPVVAVLDIDYEVDGQGNPRQPTADELPVPDGAVEAHWYRGVHVWVALFGGWSLEDTGPLCPGTSLQVGNEFDHLTNSPTEPGDPCEDHPDIVLAGEGSGVRICGDLVLYISEIPLDAEGTLFASVERYQEDGAIVGLTGSVAADADAAPPIDAEAGGYELPPELGGATVTC